MYLPQFSTLSEACHSLGGIYLRDVVDVPFGKIHIHAHGTYGWGGCWGGDAFLVFLVAQMEIGECWAFDIEVHFSFPFSESRKTDEPSWKGYGDDENQWVFKREKVSIKAPYRSPSYLPSSSYSALKSWCANVPLVLEANIPSSILCVPTTI